MFMLCSYYKFLVHYHISTLLSVLHGELDGYWMEPDDEIRGVICQ